MCARSRENPLLSATIPTTMPQIKPTKPITAFKSPPPIRSIILSGQPKNINAPIITKKPKTKRTTGFEPLLAINSFFENAMTEAPKTIPIISGLRYCTTPALWSFKAPAVSLMKQAMHKPMLPGFPNFTSRTASKPTIIPVEAINTFSFFIFLLLFLMFLKIC